MPPNKLDEMPEDWQARARDWLEQQPKEAIEDEPEREYTQQEIAGMLQAGRWLKQYAAGKLPPELATNEAHYEYMKKKQA